MAQVNLTDKMDILTGNDVGFQPGLRTDADTSPQVADVCDLGAGFNIYVRVTRVYVDGFSFE